MRLQIADLDVEISQSLFFNSLTRFTDFRIPEPDSEPQCRVTLIPALRVTKPDNPVFLEDTYSWIQRDDCENNVTVFESNQQVPQDGLIFRVDVHNNWQNAAITFREKHHRAQEKIAQLIGYLVFRNIIVYHQGLIIHSAAISWQGKGILFAAPSGTGKSTQADLWVHHKHATILNDDSPAVRVSDDNISVFGTPWCGSRNVYRNAQAPLRAIIILNQANRNAIRKLTPSEATALLIPRCFLPYHSPTMIDLACSVLEKIILRTPVYHLHCRPDREAVEAVARCLQ